MTDDTLAVKLTKCLFEHEPKLLASDLNASVMAAKEVANLLGCIMATFLVKKGEDDYLECMKMIGQFVDGISKEDGRQGAEYIHHGALTWPMI